MNNIFSLRITQKQAGQRIDRCVAESFEDISRSSLQKAIKNNLLKVNEQIISSLSYKIKEGDRIKFEIIEKLPENITPSDIPLDIFFEDEDLIVINKPAGMVTHPGAGIYTGTLVNALMHHSNQLSDMGDEMRPGIVHRLDKDTSGLMVVAKNNLTHVKLADQIKERELKRKYKALVWGMVKPLSGIIDLNIARSSSDRKKMAVVKNGGKHAITHYETLEIFAGGTFSLIACQLETGRTHQIRVHLSHVRHSIVGDGTYGNNNRKSVKLEQSTPKDTELARKFEEKIKIIKSFHRQALHSYYIGFNHPTSGEFIEFESPLPDDYTQVLEAIRGL